MATLKEEEFVGTGSYHDDSDPDIEETEGDTEDDDDAVSEATEEDVDVDGDGDVDTDPTKMHIGGALSDDEGVEASDDDEDDDDDAGDQVNISKPLVATKAKKPILEQIDTDDEDDEEDDYTEDYLQKFDKDINNNYIVNFHPECKIHNYDEIATLTKVVRNDSGIIMDPFHRTIPILTKYERTRILGQRAKQINSGSRPFVKIPENIIDGYLVAELELSQKRIPFIIRRPLPNGSSEYWNLKDLELVD